MIGVIVKKTERLVAAEFFELFKTPWEFYQEGSSYDVIVTTGAPPSGVGDTAQIVYSSDTLPGDRSLRVFHPGSSPHWLDATDYSMPLYGRLTVFEARPHSTALVYSAGQKAGLCTRESGRGIVRIGYDLFGEVERLLVHGQPPEQAGRPALEQHIHLLRSLILSLGIPLVEVPPTPHGYTMTACLTHDVDFVGIKDHGFNHTIQGFLHRALFGSVRRLMRRELTLRQTMTNWAAALSLPLVHLGLRRDFWREFDRYGELERGHPSTYYFIPYKNRPGRNVSLPHPERRAAAYDLGAVQADIQAIRRRGGEAALHGIDAWLDPSSARDERQRLASETGAACTGHRSHWLCFNTQSPLVLDEAGFDYDSTCGYNETVGFKAGTCQVFRPLGVRRLLELPMQLQDVALFYPTSLGLSPAAAWREMTKILDTIADFGGVAAILWHTRSLSPERLWDEPYIKLIDELERRGAWFGAAASVTEWFRARRQLKLTRDAISTERVRVHIEGPSFQPGCTLRVHIPIPSHGAWGVVRQYDVPWSGEAEVQIDLMAHTAREKKIRLPGAPSLSREEAPIS
ncbi:MAG: hypothetical protein A2X46_05650 [Lentisphaerae bacterium GWF2_57_35]|nr:MAG: hypothetical protein A2X46_05650 [Lentisphaerae bacterium GWF2_57_35]